MLTINRLHGITTAWRAIMWGSFLALLLAPLVAMQLTREVQWTAYDFAVAAALLVVLGLSTEMLVRSKRSLWIRVTGFAVCVGAALVICADGAVGVF
ncbi:hypothetical protein F1C10_14550 [Sphingomonas sp. NBWT7]|uniref:hypothetical protein n=1 Tax=Sphingomonas sp. NBWT7 TaxID=2596913 RepID=UPI00162A8BF5|nr:hypothetical protein [Sphingomonas sp. NBWT7]QNE33017.1 hypothetical protein F1C10_14550 [Sphingomonas sp. NBWT7]